MQASGAAVWQEVNTGPPAGATVAFASNNTLVYVCAQSGGLTSWWDALHACPPPAGMNVGNTTGPGSAGNCARYSIGNRVP